MRVLHVCEEAWLSHSPAYSRPSCAVLDQVQALLVSAEVHRACTSKAELLSALLRLPTGTRPV